MDLGTEGEARAARHRGKQGYRLGGGANRSRPKAGRLDLAGRGSAALEQGARNAASNGLRRTSMSASTPSTSPSFEDQERLAAGVRRGGHSRE